MSDIATAAADSPTDLVSFNILCNKVALSREYRILSLDVVKSSNKISTAKVSIVDGNPAEQDFPVSSKNDTLLPGNDFEIQLGYHSKTKTVFQGVIVKQSIKSGKNRQSVLTLEAKDKFFKLALGRKSQSFTDKTDSEIIADVVKDAGFAEKSTAIEETKVQFREMLQYNASDWDFIVSRAEMNSMLVFTDDNQLIIKKPDTVQDASIEIIYGQHVIEMESEMDARTQVEEVHSHAWDFKEQARVDAESSSVPFKETGGISGSNLASAMGISNYQLFHTGGLQPDELQSWSEAILLKSRMSKITGTVKVKGMSEIKPGQVIKLTGFGKQMSGNAYVTGVRHSYGTSIWETDIQFGLPQACFYQKEDIIEKPAAGLLPGVTGLQIGIVVALENDPELEDRVKVQLPMVDQHQGIWARVAALDAGKDRGAYFRPEINDEVVLGFLNDDPRHAVILGMLNSSAHPAPLPTMDTNNEKGFITRSKLKLIFNDEKKSVGIETPNGKKITIDDDANSIVLSDQNNNKIQLDASGITIESSKNISFKTATGDIKIEANNIKSEASMQFSALGNVAAELKSSGQTVIKGAIVSIN
jgi:Rhs element Vgr protein